MKSLRQEARDSYANMVVKMYHEYEEAVFNLSEQSANETIDSIKNMTLLGRIQFQKNINRKIERLSRRGKESI